MRARIRLADGRSAEGMAAELLAPKWFDKNPALSNEDNFDQLRTALAIARRPVPRRHASTRRSVSSRSTTAAQIEHGGDARSRAAGRQLRAGADRPGRPRRAVPGARPAVPRGRAAQPGRHRAGDLCPDLAGFDFDAFLAGLRPAATIEARHTVGLLDPITRADQTERVGDGLPETLEEVVAAYGHRWFKLKVAGDVGADIDRLSRHRRRARPHRRRLPLPRSTATSSTTTSTAWSSCGSGCTPSRAWRASARASPSSSSRSSGRAALAHDVGALVGAQAGDRRRVGRLPRRLRPRPRRSATAASPRRPARGSTSRSSTRARCALWNRDAADDAADLQARRTS